MAAIDEFVNRIICGDCLAVMKQLPDKCVDFAFADPPYGIGKAEWDDKYFEGFEQELLRLSRKGVAITPGQENIGTCITALGANYKGILAARNKNGMTFNKIGFGNWIPVVVGGSIKRGHYSTGNIELSTSGAEGQTTAKDMQQRPLKNKWRYRMGNTKHYTIEICDDCYELRGEACHNPACVFCRQDMETVGEVLDILLIRPVVNGERLEAGYKLRDIPLEIYADGGCKNQQDPENREAYGSYKIADWEINRKFYGNRTSNEAEYLILIDALKAVKKAKPVEGVQIIIYTDSTLVEGQLNKAWKVNKAHLRPLVDEASALLKETGAKLVKVGREKLVEVLGH